ncbi:MAG: NAD(P)-binding protein [Acidimicrobiaceae bacterium]|nr:FAD-dependent oxidoreductase [Acidimicrobiaceae bacterium]MXW61154.1 NAD(P)-binding protein [Acidimicrobiaceae bacterium]MXW74534.1 NAD(P)-binding protein [Acidimicrobiaceae bacterium]MYA73552.1 NAD(P)-binding protein [Acidimicrobiaceae bacterium]MYC41488.1 NAD(P)-binding protein [Acidimicrobiaceae bacterium]
MASKETGESPRRIAIVGGGVSGLGAAWALNRHPDRFDIRVFEATERLGGNAITADMPQDDGTQVPFDISVTACIPSVYQHILLLLDQFDIDLVETRFSYSVKYGGRIYAHDFDSEIREQLQPEIEKFQRILRRLKRFGWLSRSPSKALNAINPFNYISMGTVLNWGGFSGDFRYKILKPMFVNFLMATNVFDMPAALFARYLEFFDIESATPMQTWDQGTRRIYAHLSADFVDKIHLNRPVHKVYRSESEVVVEDEEGVRETFDEVIFACNANQTLMILDNPTRFERYLLSSIRYESELHNHTIVHSDSSVLPDNEVKPLTTRSNHIEQYGTRPDNYEITYIMHNQQPWANRSDKPCLVTYNPISPIDEEKIVKKWWFQHIVHDVRHVTLIVNTFRFVQGKRRTWHCGAHTLINSQETCFVTGLAAATQLGADYPFDDPEARRLFNYYGSILHGVRFRKVKR